MQHVIHLMRFHGIKSAVWGPIFEEHLFFILPVFVVEMIGTFDNFPQLLATLGVNTERFAPHFPLSHPILRKVCF